ncbi:hypothetical protein F503_03036 [Ophiostoma piceae UAMH 11346]|uniref:Uncharacterized protein n=1 Tax=Ophiostoma piceae (strain UAMH 11346) TaxID=1262450 RepID=S3C0E1_OPHP1|nr:hypothetical protein F503_03036 [Ophiostoma piceae UAMH 11346]
MTSDLEPQRADKLDKTTGMSAAGLSDPSDPAVGRRVLFKGRLKAPQRDLLSATTAAHSILKNELTVHGPDTERAPVIEVNSTALPQPFLNPDKPLGQ